MSTLKPFPLLAVLVGSALFAAACSKPAPSAGPNAAAAQPANGARVVAITADDTMKYSVTEIRAKPGEKLRLSLANVGRMPKQAMAHNWVLLTPRPESDVMAFSMSVSSKAPNYLPDDMSSVLAHIKLLGPGERDQIDVTAPTTPGEYPFLCTFPGHAALMKGKLIVN